MIGRGAVTPPSSLLLPPQFSVPFRRRTFVHVARAAVRAEQFARLGHVEEHARMHVPHRGRGRGAVQRQVLLRDLDGALLLLCRGGHQRFPFLAGLAVAGLGLPVTALVLPAAALADLDLPTADLDLPTADLDLPTAVLDLPTATGASQSLWRSSLPLTTSKNAFCSLRVTGPRRPAPILRPSTSRIGVTSAAVPVKKASSAMYRSSRVMRFGVTV